MSIRTISPVLPLLLGTAMLVLGMGIQGLLLPLRGQIEGFTPFMIGAMGSAYSAGFICGCLIGPRLVERAGHIRTFASFVAIASCVVLLHSMLVDALAWWTLRAMTGCCTAILFMVCESWLNDKADNANRGALFSVYGILCNAMGMVGQLSVAAVDPTSTRIFMAGSILVSLAAVPVAMSRAEAPRQIVSVKLRPQRILAISPVGFVGCIACGIAMGATGTLLPVYGAEIGFDISSTAYLCASAALAAALGTWPLGLMSDRMDRRYVIIVAAVGAALSGIFLATSGQASPAVTFAGVIALSGFSIPLYALSVAHTNDHVSPGAFVETSGGLLLIWATGTMVGPMAGSALMGLLGPAGLFVATAAAHASLALYASWRITRRAAPELVDRGAFVDAVAATQTVSSIEPLSTVDREVHLDQRKAAAA
jgi:MFS family permease